MSNKKFKLTGFARFFIAMVILAPMAYIGASYYNGQDGIENLKNLFSKGELVEVVAEESAERVAEKPTKEVAPVKEVKKPSKEYVNSQIKKLQDDLSEKEARVEKLYLENEELKKQLKDQAAEFKEVKEQLAKIKKAIGQ